MARFRGVVVTETEKQESERPKQPPTPRIKCPGCEMYTMRQVQKIPIEKFVCSACGYVETR